MSNNPSFYSTKKYVSVQESLTQLAQIATIDGFITVHHSGETILLQLIKYDEAPTHPDEYVAQPDAPIRQSLAAMLGCEHMPKNLQINELVLTEHPIRSASADNKSVQDFLECSWSDFIKDRILIQCNLAYDNSEADCQNTLRVISNMNRLARQRISSMGYSYYGDEDNDDSVRRQLYRRGGVSYEDYN